MPSAYHPHLGGVEELTRQLGLKYQARGHEPLIVTNQWPRDLPSFEVVEGLPVYRFPFRFPNGNARAALNYHLTNGSISWRFGHLLTAQAIDIMHIQCISSNGLYGLRAKRRLGIPLLVTSQGEITMDTDRLFQENAAARRLLRSLLEEADGFTCVSGKTRDDLLQLTGFDRFVRLIPNGVAPAEMQTSTPYHHLRQYILMIGRLVPEKGFSNVLRAMARFPTPALDAIIAGDGPLRAQLEAEVHHLGLADRVRFWGRADRRQVAELLAGCTLLVLPSVADEGWPLVAVEAMTAGVPIVATRSGGLPELIEHNVHGILVDCADDGALASAISLLSASAPLRSRLSRNAKARALQFTWDQIASEYISLYESIVEGA